MLMALSVPGLAVCAFGLFCQNRVLVPVPVSVEAKLLVPVHAGIGLPVPDERVPGVLFDENITFVACAGGRVQVSVLVILKKR